MAIQGRILIFSGSGKGKTSAAIGTCIRAIGNGMVCALINFLKAGISGEHYTLERLEIPYLVSGGGWVKDGPTPNDMMWGAKGITAVKAYFANTSVTKNIDLLVLDEVITAIELKVLDIEQVRELIASKPQGMHLILTGRGPWEKLEDLADTITVMQDVKHIYDVNKTSAAIGIEY